MLALTNLEYVILRVSVSYLMVSVIDLYVEVRSSKGAIPLIAGGRLSHPFGQFTVINLRTCKQETQWNLRIMDTPKEDNSPSLIHI